MHPRLHRTIQWLFLIAVVIVAAAAVNLTDRAAPRSRAAEIASAIRSAKTEVEQLALLNELLAVTGPEVAQELLETSGLAFSIGTHTLAHEIGHALYRTWGAQAVQRCRDYFYFGCYHGVMHSALADRDPEVIPTVLSECEALGSNIAARCYHGLGHSFLAGADYDIPAALGKCDAFRGETTRNLESCASGVFMENGTGISERHLAKERWIRSDDPSFPCSDPRIPDIYVADCWRMQWSVMAAVFGNDTRQIANGCMRAPTDAAKHQCFDYFVGWVVNVEAGDDIDRILALCESVSPPGWSAACVGYAAGQAFEARTSSHVPFAICARVDGGDRESCYGTLISTINKLYATGTADRTRACGRIGEITWASRCLRGPEVATVNR